MFEHLANGWKFAVAVATSQYTHGTVIGAVGGVIHFIPALSKIGGAVVAAMGVYVLVRAGIASARKS